MDFKDQWCFCPFVCSVFFSLYTTVCTATPSSSPFSPVLVLHLIEILSKSLHSCNYTVAEVLQFDSFILLACYISYKVSNVFSLFLTQFAYRCFVFMAFSVF